jgi:Heavy metal binding domain
MGLTKPKARPRIIGPLAIDLQWFLLRTVALALVFFLAAAQPAVLPPVSWSCPMHPEVIEDSKGICPICKMDLVPVRLDTVWSCPVHSVVSADKPGKCPICRRDLVQVTVALSWTCPDHPEIDRLNPGKCPNGAAMIPKRVLRAHGNHHPQHGGTFFMAPDTSHHLEGTYTSGGLFRLHLYDDYSRPLPIDKLKQAKGRVQIGARQLPLVPAANGQFLEADIGELPLPASLTAMIAFAPNSPEYRFDFTFPELSQDPARDASGAAAAGVESTLTAIEIPQSPQDILTLLSARNRRIADLIQRGSFAEIYVSALQAKDLALALDAHAKELPATRRAMVSASVKRLVRSAWMLDTYGDLGNRAPIADAYVTFSAAVAELESAFRTRSR